MRKIDSIFDSCDRRKFISACAALLPVSYLNMFPDYLPPNSTSFSFEKVGLNLGSVQDQLANNPMETVNLINRLGLRHLELPGTSLLRQLHPILSGAGFKISSSHFYSPYITGNWAPMGSMGMKLPKERDFKSVIEIAQKYELEYLVMPGIFPEDRGGLEVYQKLADKLNESGQQCQNAGIQLCYHHYSYEFQPMEDSSPLREMLKILDSSLVKLETDTFWLSLADISALDFLEEHQAFLGPMHLADKSGEAPQTYRAVTLPKGSHLPVGEGVVPFDKILNAAAINKAPYFFIHLENMVKPLEALQKSATYLKRLSG